MNTCPSIAGSPFTRRPGWTDRPVPRGTGCRGTCRVVVFFALVLGFPATGWATPPPPARIPQALRPLLSPWAQRWDRMSPARQSLLLKRARRWQRMNPRERQRILRNWRRWHRLPPALRNRIRHAYHRFRELPPDRRRALLKHWRQLGPIQRRRWLRHPKGRHIPHAFGRWPGHGRRRHNLE
jgi:hypothetical protein